jgi:hypothetical protein
MIRVGKESTLAPEEVVERAMSFFGPSGAGLRVVNQGACCARFEGAVGYVSVQTAEVDEQQGSDVTVEGREWEYQIRQFIREI